MRTLDKEDIIIIIPGKHLSNTYCVCAWLTVVVPGLPRPPQNLDLLDPDHAPNAWWVFGEPSLHP